jgi:hypothetical protein
MNLISSLSHSRSKIQAGFVEMIFAQRHRDAKKKKSRTRRKAEQEEKQNKKKRRTRRTRRTRRKRVSSRRSAEMLENTGE